MTETGDCNRNATPPVVSLNTYRKLYILTYLRIDIFIYIYARMCVLGTMWQLMNQVEIV